MVVQDRATINLNIVAYAPTEFFHCQHCEFVWKQAGIGARFHAEQRGSGLLPPDLAADYAAISDWVADAIARCGDRLSITLIDAVSIEGIWKCVRYRLRRFPAFLFGDGERILGFDRERLDAALARRLDRPTAV
jgi:hypothetical protein